MPTLAECIATFLKIDRSPHTNRQYGLILHEMARAIGPDRAVGLIRYEDLLDYLDRRRNKPHQRTRGQIKPATIAGYVTVIKAFFAWCARAGYVETSPAANIQRKPPSRDPTRSRAVPPDELARMVEYARVTSPRNYAMLLFLADTGCRVGGLVSLTLDNLDLVTGRATLLEKGGAWHRVYFTDETADALRAWLKLRPNVSHKYVWTGPGPDHAPLGRLGAAEMVKRIAERTGASRPWGPHSIRHAVGHAYAQAGVPVTITQLKLGHKHPNITMSNYYPDDEKLVEAASHQHPLSALNRQPPTPPASSDGPILRLVKRKTSSG